MAKSSFIISMDVGGTNVRIGAISSEGVLENIEICRSSVLVKDLPAIDGTIKFIRDFIEKHKYKDIEAISIGFPSTISKDRKVMFDEPTRGIDVGAKSEIYKIMRKLADEGKGVMMVSSELPELLSICDRIIVFSNGEIKTVLDSNEATEEKIIIAAT